MSENRGDKSLSTPAPESSRPGRWKFLKFAAATGVAFLGLSSARNASAQIRPIPGYQPTEPQPASHIDQAETKLIPPPKEIREMVEDAVEKFTPFLNESHELKIQYVAESGPNVVVAPGYETEKSDEKIFVNPSLAIYYTKNKQSLKYLELLTKQQLAIHGSRNADNYPSKMFAEDFQKYAGISLEALGLKKAGDFSGALVDQQARVAELQSYFDLSRYAGSSQNKPFINSNSSESEKLYSAALAFWISDINLGEKVKSARESDRKLLANVFLSALKRASDTFAIGIDFNTSGVNQRSLDDLLQISGNEIYQRYFSAKRNPAAA